MSISDAIGGSLISGAGSLAGGMLTNAQSADNVASQEAFQEQMSDTAHQREVADLKAAGLNPVLSAGGTGASAPAGSVAPVVNSIGDAMQAGLSSYSALQQSRQVDPAIAKTQADTALSQALSAKAAADTTTALATARNTDADTQIKKTGAAGRFLGSDAATVGSSFISNAADTISSKLKDIISNIHVNSAKALSRSPAAATNYSGYSDVNPDGTLTPWSSTPN